MYGILKQRSKFCGQTGTFIDRSRRERFRHFFTERGKPEKNHCNKRSAFRGVSKRPTRGSSALFKATCCENFRLKVDHNEPKFNIVENFRKVAQMKFFGNFEKRCSAILLSVISDERDRWSGEECRIFVILFNDETTMECSILRK